MLRPMEVAARDRRQARVRHPAEDLTLVEELVAVDQPAEQAPRAPEATGETVGSVGIVAVWMCREYRRSLGPGCGHGLRQSAIHRHESAQADGDGMAGEIGVRIVVRELGS